MKEWLLFLVLLYLGLTFAFFQWIFNRHLRKSFLNRTQDLKQANYDFIQPAKQWLNDQQPQSLRVRFKDGHERFAYFLPSSKPNQPTVLLLHGYSVRNLSMAPYAQHYRDVYDYNVCLVDALGHGQSEGDTIGFGYQERHDVNAWIDHLKTLGCTGSFLLHGVSMGASTSLFSLTSGLDPQVKGLIADSPFIQLEPIFVRQAKQMFNLPAGLLLPGLYLWMKLFLGYSLQDVDFMKHLDAIDRPLLLIHGTADFFVPFTQSEELKKAHPQGIALWLVKDSQHACAYGDQKAAYQTQLKTFIKDIDL